MKFYYGRSKTKMLFVFLFLHVICFFNNFVFQSTIAEFHHDEASTYFSHKHLLISVTYSKHH